MGMTIEEAIRDLVYLKECSIFPFSYYTHNGQQMCISTGNCVEVAIDTMRKYQKITEIVKSWRENGLDYDSCDAMDNIERVIEDGKD